MNILICAYSQNKTTIVFLNLGMVKKKKIYLPVINIDTHLLLEFFQNIQLEVEKSTMLIIVESFYRVWSINQNIVGIERELQ